MRQRRAERCLLKAHQALRAGLVEEARRCCVDAREMVPTLPDLASLEARIAALPARHRHTGLATAAACSAVLALTTLMAWHTWIRPSPQLHRHTAQTDIVLVAPARSLAVASRPVEPVQDRRDPRPLASRNAAVPQPQPREQAVARTAPRNRTSFDPAVAARPAPLEPSPFPAAETAPAPLAPSPEPNSGSLTASAPSNPDAESEPSADRAAIHRTLARYEAAYTDLDASAARAVWPTVDQQALARAFDGLAAQRIALNECDVRVTGGTARATCSGAATWTAKVGGRQGREARTWAFELKNASGSWQIVRAETR